MMSPCQLPGPHLISLHSMTCAVCLMSCLHSASGYAGEWLMASLAASKSNVHDCVCQDSLISHVAWMCSAEHQLLKI